MAFVIRRVLLTGTPGAGKTTLAKALAKKWRVPLVSINDFAKANRLTYRAKGEREDTVKLKPLAEKLAAHLKKLGAPKTGFVVDGHLGCEFALPVQRVVVLRVNPSVLERRLSKRHYPQKKIAGNVESEALDYCLLQAREHYPARLIVEVDATRRVPLSRLLGAVRTGKGDAVRWNLRFLAL